MIVNVDVGNRDRSSWSCTLFDRVYDQDNVQSSVRLQLLQSSKPLAVYGADIDQDNSLFAQADDLNQTAYALQAVSLDLLPEIFALQLSNGIFLAASRYGRFDYLRFNNTDIGSSAIRHQVMHRQADGTMAVKSLGFNAFWENRSMTPDRILGSASVYNSSQRSMLFRPLQVDRERVAILNVGRNLFCRRTGDGSTSDNYFSPMASTLEDIVLLKVREPVISRSVRTVVYDLANIEIYDKRPLLAATVVATNKTTTTHTVLLNLTRKVKNSRTWSNSVSFTTGIKVSFTMGIPSIGQSGVEVSNSRTTTQEWDETEEEEITLGGQYEYTVDPGEMLTVNLHATQGKFSLKFSYVQEDLRSTGERVTDSKNDGLFTGINYFDVHTEHSSKPINT